MEINQKQYGAEKEAAFLETYHKLVAEYQIEIQMPVDSTRFMKQWYLPGVRAEIDLVYSLIRRVEDPSIQNALMLILSRTISLVPSYDTRRFRHATEASDNNILLQKTWKSLQTALFNPRLVGTIL